MKNIKGIAKSSLEYTGIVNLSQYINGKKFTIAQLHNAGGKPLFEFLADCLVGDFEIAKFYVIKEKTDEARELGLKSKSLVLNTVLFCVLSVVAVVCLIFLMPEILTLVNNIFA